MQKVAAAAPEREDGAYGSRLRGDDVGYATTADSSTSAAKRFALTAARTIIGSARPRMSTSCCGNASGGNPAVLRTSSEKMTSHERLLVMSCSRAATLTASPSAVSTLG